MHHRLVSTARTRKAVSSSTQRARSCRPRVEELEGRVLLTAYYVSPSGNDSNNGTSQSTPWKTIARVNTADLNGGDSVNFQGGATFSPNTPLTFQPNDSGTPSNPVRITSYGTGRAIIQMNSNLPAIEGQHVSGYKIDNLSIKGPGWATSTKSGVFFYSWAAGNLEYLHINNVDISGFGDVAVTVQASNNISTFTDIEIVNSDLSYNKQGGFESIGPGAGGNHTARTIFGVYLANLRIMNNAEITFGSVSGGVLENSISANDGYTGDVASGVFVYDSSYIVIRNNEFYGMVNYGTGTDGNGISLDYGSTNCIVEGNYTHNNGGAGILLVGSNWPGFPPTTGNIIRYNVSENNGWMYTFGEISAYRGVSNTEIHNNTVYTTYRDAFQIWDWKGSGIHVRNNIFMTSGAPTNWLVHVFPPNNPAQKLSDLDVVFQGNNYYTKGGAFNINYGMVFYHTLSSWQNGTGQEKMYGQPVGTTINPQLVNPGGGGNVNNPALLDSLDAYKLQPRSRLRYLGLDMTLFGINPGSYDFFGNPLPSGPTIAVGAHDPSDPPGRGSEGEGRPLGIVLPTEDSVSAPSNAKWSAPMLTSQLDLESSLIGGGTNEWVSDASLATASDWSGQRAALERPRGLGDAILGDALAGAGTL